MVNIHTCLTNNKQLVSIQLRVLLCLTELLAWLETLFFIREFRHTKNIICIARATCLTLALLKVHKYIKKKTHGSLHHALAKSGEKI